MSIPDRFYRIAKHKLGEVKDWFDKIDAEDLDDPQRRRREARTDASRELNDSLTPSSGTATPNSPGPSVPPRTPSGIPMNPPRAVSPGGSGGGSGGTLRPLPQQSSTAPGQTSTPDPLDYHYRLLGLEPGADFGAVQAAYNRLSARCDPSRFPAGSTEERQAQNIRERLDASYKQLKDVLDTTATRFDRLEF